MQTTGKYNELFNQPEKPQPVNQGAKKNNQPEPTREKMDLHVLVAEVRTIIKKAFEADQPENNHQS